MVDECLTTITPMQVEFNLRKSMQYSLLGGGKRLRPILYLAVIDAYSKKITHNDLLVCSAIECIHTYSLIHDDLPAMDNDDFRRGKPTSHKVFGEDIAILAGDGLLNLAYEILFECALNDSKYTQVGKIIADSVGSQGMINGQATEIKTDFEVASDEEIDNINILKSGRLIECAILSAVISTQNINEIEMWRDFAMCFSKAFQLSDDILDCDKDAKSLAHRLGKEKSIEYIHKLYKQCENNLTTTSSNNEFILEFVQKLILRKSDKI